MRHLSVVVLFLVLGPIGSAAGRDLLAVPSGGLAAGPVAEVVCGGCHGSKGVGRPEALYPRLAGQDRLYLLKQLHDYASGARPNEIMGPIARRIPEDERGAAADYYAYLPAPPLAASAAPADVGPFPGADLARHGDTARGLPACDSCHGSEAIGRPTASPVLAGIAAPYLVAQLHLWRDGTRRNDPMSRMRQISAVLTAEEIEAVATYYAARPPGWTAEEQHHELRHGR